MGPSSTGRVLLGGSTGKHFLTGNFRSGSTGRLRGTTARLVEVAATKRGGTTGPPPSWYRLANTTLLQAFRAAVVVAWLWGQ
jgi:hypothetical protein